MDIGGTDEPDAKPVPGWKSQQSKNWNVVDPSAKKTRATIGILPSQTANGTQRIWSNPPVPCNKLMAFDKTL